MNYTSIEQSKKLIEAGLDPNTADMLYHQLGRHDEFDTFPTIGDTLTVDDTPCWSLGALIELMPTITKNELWYHFNLRKSFGVCLGFYFHIDEDSRKDEMLDKPLFGGKPIEVCVSTILWLLENGYITKVTKKEVKQ